jgi:hypothetical protein
MFLAPAAIFVDTNFFWHQKYELTPNDFDHFGTCLKASQLLAPEFQPLRLALYTATAIFAQPQDLWIYLSYQIDQKI